jgi:hypothetical protein
MRQGRLLRVAEGVEVAPLSLRLTRAQASYEPNYSRMPALQNDGCERDASGTPKLCLVITVSVEVAERDSGTPIELVMSRSFGWAERPELVARLLRELLREVIEHELDELVHIHGKRNDPHVGEHFAAAMTLKP